MFFRKAAQLFYRRVFKQGGNKAAHQWGVYDLCYELLVIHVPEEEPSLLVEKGWWFLPCGTCSCLVRVTGCSAGGKFLVYLFGL